MKPKTYFNLDNKRQLEQMYNQYKHQFDASFDQLSQTFDNGIKTLQCNEFSVIKLDNEIHPRSKEIPNPFHSSKQNQKPIEQIDVDFEKVEPGNKPKPTTDRSQTMPPPSPKSKTDTADPRRERIDIIIDTIGLEVHPDLLTKLIEVFDLEADFGDKVQINQILYLRDN